ncbi:retrovirus-related pol polyprotein from transposon TNT 1-94 [Tanacetum coccineum]
MEGWKPKSLKNKSFANIQELFEKAMKRVNTFVNYRTGLMEESSKKAETELEENLKKAEAEVMEGSSKRAGTELEQEVTKKQKVMMEDLETLWKLVKAKHGSTRPEEGYERVLWGDLKIYMLVEKKYHLTPATITDMLNKKLQCDHFSEMAYQLLKLLTKQLKTMKYLKASSWIVGIKRLLDDLRVTAAQDEVPEFVINFLKMIQVRLNATVRNIRTDNGIEFVNQTLKAYYEEVGISHQTSVAHTPQQNGVVEEVATTCYIQNRSIIQKRHNKTTYELLHDRKPDLSYLHVFGALCYPTNDNEDLGKLKLKADIGIFVGYAPAKKAFRIYNKRTYLIIETIHVDFDELSAMASKQLSSGPEPKLLTPGTISSGLMLNIPSLTLYVPPTKND